MFETKKEQKLAQNYQYAAKHLQENQQKLTGLEQYRLGVLKTHSAERTTWRWGQKAASASILRLQSSIERVNNKIQFVSASLF